MTPTPENIEYARYVASAIGLNPSAYPYYDNNKSTSVDIVSLDDPIDEEVKLYSSIGVSNYPNVIETKDGNINIPVELLMTGYQKFEYVPNILATTCFFILKDGWSCQPGSVFKNIIKDYYQLEMKHILFIRPFLWEDKLSDLKFGDKEVHPLLLMPISDEELDFQLSNGYEALEALLQENEADIYDIGRKSIL